jgi:ABC-type Fe3+/spermidine/putrescine transport system ATPase subunit
MRCSGLRAAARPRCSTSFRGCCIRRRAAAVRRPRRHHLSTQERNIAQVFQFPVIYDTMTVYDNLAFPLRNRGVPEADVDRKVREIIEMIDLATGPSARRGA